MANTIKIKAGSGTPTTSDIVDKELAFDRSADKLYINDNGTIVEVGGGTSGTITSVSNFSDNRVATASGSTTLNGEANLTFDGSTLALTGDLTVTGGSLTLPVAEKLFFGGGTHTYIGEDVDDRLRFFTGGAEFMRFTEDSSDTIHLYKPTTITGALTLEADTKLDATQKLYLDGGSHTYIAETSADTMKLVAGGQDMLILAEASDDMVYVPDSVYLAAGTGQDFTIVHDGSNTDLGNATGDLKFTLYTDDGDIRFFNDNGSGGTTEYFRMDGGAVAIDLFQDTRLKAEKKLYLDGGGNTYILESATDIMDFYAGGVHMLRLDETNNTVHIPQDSGDAVFTVGAGSDFQLYIDSDDVVMRNQTQDKDMKFIVNDGGSNVTAIQIDASEVGKVKLPNDGQTLSLGAGNDLTFQHDGSNSYIGNGVGNLYISNDTNDGDIIFRTEDGSGGVTAYIELDGSTERVDFKKPIYAEDSAYFADGSIAYFGAGNDLRIQHDGTNSWVYNNVSGHLYIENRVDDKDVIFRCDDGSGGMTGYLELDGSAKQIKLKEDIVVTATKKLYLDGGSDTYIHESSADTAEIYVGGVRMLQLSEASTDYVATGDSTLLGVGNDVDMYMKHDGTDSYIINTTGDTIIRSNSTNDDIFIQCDDGGSVITSIQIDASNVGQVKLPNDNQELRIGAGSDLALWHNGSNSYIENTATGNLYITNAVDDADVIFQSDDGSGGVTPYLTLDGSATRIKIDQNMEFQDSVALKFGTSDDMRIYHDGSNSYIRQEGTGHLYIRNDTEDKSIFIQTDDGSGGTTDYMKFSGNESIIRTYNNFRLQDSVQVQFGSGADCDMLHDGSEMIIRNDTGNFTINQQTDDGDLILKCDDGSGGSTAYLTLDGSLGALSIQKDMYRNDGVNIYMGSHSDQYMYYDGTNDIGYWRATTGDITIRNDADDKDIILMSDDGSGGTTQYIRIDGSAGLTQIDKDMKFVDNVEAQFGSSTDMKIYHNSSSGNGNFENNTGSLYVTNYTDDADIIFRTDDGSGDVTAYLTLDGTNKRTLFSEQVRIADSKQLGIGNGDDLEIKHDGSHTIMQLNNGNLYFKDQSGNNIIHIMREGDGVQMSEGDFTIPATSKLRLDGSTSGHTYIYEESDDNVMFYIGGRNMLRLHEGNGEVVVNDSQVDTNFRVEGDSDANLLFTDAGNDRVGIGTGSPEGKVHIYQSDASVAPDSDGDDLVIESDADTGISILAGESDGETGSLIFGSDNDAYGAGLAYHYYDKTLSLKTAHSSGILRLASANNSEAMRINSSGNVGIGETNIDAKLHISNGTGLTNVKMERVGNAAWRFGIAASGVDFVLDDSSDDLSTPEFAFQNDGDFHADGDVIAYSTTTSSDERLKENIKEIPYGLEEVLKMKPVEYDWKEKRGGKHDIGVIAQDIEKLIPEIIKENKDLKTKEDFKSVDYGKMVAVLIKAIQEQQEEIDCLKANYDQLKYNRR